jgi:hypothetical protein
MPALAKERGGGHGKVGGQAEAHGGAHGQGRAQQRAARVQQGGGHGKGQAARQLRVERGNGHARQAERRAVREAQRVQHEGARGGGHDRAQREARRIEDRDWNGWLSNRGGDRHVGDRFAYWREGRPLPVSLAQGGCPPGLAKQNAFCLPPGQLRKAQMIGRRIGRDRFRPVPDEWLYRFRDDDAFSYLYDDDGFIYRIDRETGFVSSIFPLIATGLSVGEPLPLGYEVYNLPVPYRDYFVDDDEWRYRYDDGAIYRVDNDSGLIDSIVALLTDTPLSVGAPLPPGYDVYNVPLSYRDRYADSGEALYRYANGGIFEIDPQTMLVQALIEMVV